ncbi:MAG: rhodanese-like domain-containing protein [Candidatus Kapabacteria bacterium]|nr:rhodanese-like domain-containing protein [Candidatus Kapabacteria bacterium]
MLGFLKNMMGGGDNAVAEAIGKGAVIIDVRTRQEYSGGHVAGSKNIPLQELGPHIASLPADKPIVFCCASGGRSGQATSMASQAGKEAYNGGPWTSVNRIVNNR